MTKLRRLLAALPRTLVALVAGSVIVAGAADEYPAKPIRVIVPGPPGVGVDLDARTITEKMSEALRVPLVIENLPAAGGIVAMETAKKAAPDGYTLIIAGIGPLAAFPYLHRKLPYDADRDFAPISLLQVLSSIIVIHPSVGANSVEDLVAKAKANPGKLSFASQGNGTFVHLAAELFMSVTGVELTHVPYGGQSPFPDLVGGHVDMMFTGVAPVIGNVRSGKLKILAVSAKHRLEILPHVPTAAEAGVPDYDVGAWIGLLAPRGTPAAIVGRLNAVAANAMKSREVSERVTKFGGTLVGSSPAEFEQFIRAEQKKWSKVIRDAKLQLN